jgi:hypothetical protein
MKTDGLTFYALAQRKGTLALCLVLCTLGLGLSAIADEPTFTTFNAPGAGTAAGQGTIGIGINAPGAIEGYYLDASNVYHAFVRARNGTITTFDAPGAGAGAFQGTVAFGLTDAGDITGYYLDGSNVVHGFLRTRSGAITTFDVPGAGTSSFQGTIAGNINAAGEISGEYVDASNVFHGFLRARDGTFTTFDAPGAGTGPGQGTFTAFFSGLNNEGTITAWYADAGGVLHGYVRAPGGVITTFDALGAGTGSGQGTEGGTINRSGVIAGSYVDASNVFHGFLRAKNSAITILDAPGAGTVGIPGCLSTFTCQGTYAQNINPKGVITGQYVDASGVNHGFLRAKHGTITNFDAPGAGTGTGQGTIAFSNNPADAITGYYIDAGGVYHGFLRIPCGEGDQGDENCEE